VRSPALAHTAKAGNFSQILQQATGKPRAHPQTLRRSAGRVGRLQAPAGGCPAADQLFPDRAVGIKVFADGVLEYPSQTAVLSKPYRTSGKNGELLFDPAEFARIAVAADKQGMIVHVHAIGDQAVTEALNGIQAARKANGNSGLPHTITHLQLIRPEDIPRFRELGVIASFQL